MHPYLEQKTLLDILREQTTDIPLRRIIESLARSVKYINFAIRSGTTLTSTTKNPSGDTQIPIDRISDTLIEYELSLSEYCHLSASEEKQYPTSHKTHPDSHSYAVSYDPLDGSSIFESNFSVGSVFGIWDTPHFENTTGAKIKSSCYSIYGPQVIFVCTLENTVFQFQLNDVGEFVFTQQLSTLNPNTSYFAPGNLKSAAQNENYKRYIDTCIQQQKTLRYSGGMISDLHHIITKKEGVFLYPKTPNKPAKLRLLFECAPCAHIIEKLQGKAVTQEGVPILTIPLQNTHQTESILLGSRNEIDTLLSFFS